MQRISTDKAERAIQVLTESFQSNPSALWVIKQDDQVKARLRALIEYAVKTALENDGLFLSDDESAAAICFKEPAKVTLASYVNQLRLIRKAISISRVPHVLKREGYLKKHRPEGPFLNFWFLGVDPSFKERKAVYEIKEGIFELAHKEELPILLETSVERNMRIYERYGFKVYHTWQQSDTYTLWFMIRE